MTLLYYSSFFLEHNTGNHPENADRLCATVNRLEKSGLARRCTEGRCAPLDEEGLARIHDAGLVIAVRDLAEQGGGGIGPETAVSPRSFDVALLAAGTCQAAVDAVLKGDDPTALCLVRPPGHHATPTRSMGFCLFNNVALAAEHACTAHGLTRVLIIDWDVHHGNGTQEIFYEEPRVMYFSIHRFGSGFYPGTGDRTETGTGRGLGTTLNVPVALGTPRARYLSLFRQALDSAAAKNKPELVLISAGFDAHALDTIGSLGLEAEDFATMTQQVMEVARTHAHGRLVSCLEGGYNRDALAESVQVHLEVLLRASGG
jgi:acetoin utilization deacetylase AcuC-like enzyme